MRCEKLRNAMTKVAVVPVVTEAVAAAGFARFGFEIGEAETDPFAETITADHG